MHTHSSEHTHTHTHTHTHCEHTPGAVGSHLCCGTRGAVGGSVPCSSIEDEESTVHLLPPPTIPAGPRLELTFTFMHLADAFIQSDLQCIQATHCFYFFISMCVLWELNPQPFALLTQCSTTEPQKHSLRFTSPTLYNQATTSL